MATDMKIISWGLGFFLHHRITSAVKTVQTVNNMILYIVLKGCYNTVPNLHAPTKDKSDDSRDSSYEELAGIQSVS
jgi:hypothetical protein